MEGCQLFPTSFRSWLIRKALQVVSSLRVLAALIFSVIQQHFLGNVKHFLEDITLESLQVLMI